MSDDSTATKPSERVVAYRRASRALWNNPASRALASVVAKAEAVLTPNDWKWIRGEWHT